MIKVGDIAYYLNGSGSKRYTKVQYVRGNEVWGFYYRTLDEAKKTKLLNIKTRPEHYLLSWMSMNDMYLVESCAVKPKSYTVASFLESVEKNVH